jgi:RHS repeat-associated protein
LDYNNFWLGDRIFAKYDQTNGTSFLHGSNLGSVSMITGPTNVATQGEIFYPWGAQWATGGGVQEEHFAKFPQRDPGTSLDYTLNRMYPNWGGRWLTPDRLPWIGWQHGDEDDQKKFESYVANPQNLNMYAYVLNNPQNKTDPTGMNACGTNNDSTCHVTITIQDRSKDANGHYNDQFAGLSHQGEYNATVTVNVNGKDVGTFLVKTTPDDSSKSATLKAGVYEGTFVMHKGKYAAIAIGPGAVPTLGPNPSSKDEASIATGIHIHHAGSGDAAFARHGPPVSEGCQVVCTSQYSTFQRVTGIVPTAGTPQNAFTIDVRTTANEPQ